MIAVITFFIMNRGMIMGRKECIGVVLTQPTINYQSSVLQGIYRKAFELDLNVAVFYASTKEGCFTDTAYCEEEIFNLPNPEKLYGIIFMPDLIQFKHIDKIKERYRNITECPVICFDIEEDGFICLTSNDNKVVRDNIHHLYECHGCTDIAYMTGIKGHPHAESRLEAYRKTMAELGLEVDEERIYYGDFWYDEGENFVKKLIESPKGLPQAIACASNRMAHSVCEALEKRHVNIPNDIIVTGYWENDKELEYISSTGKDLLDAGVYAVEMLSEIRNGRINEKKNYSFECGSIVNMSKTCGCYSNDSSILSNVAPILSLEEDMGYFSLYNSMKEVLQDAEDFYDFFWKMDWYTWYMKPFSQFSFCFSEGWNTSEGVKKFTDKMYMVYSASLKCEEEYDRDVCFTSAFDVSDMHPALWEDYEKPCVFYFEPVFTKNRCYGYVCLSYGNTDKIPDDCYRFWIRDVKLCLESQRRMQEIKFLYNEMQKSAITNLMTGLYNRNGFNMLTDEMLKQARDNDDMIAVIMADLNCLKYINDTFGHEAGDEAIKTAGNAIKSVKCLNAGREENFRMGGDEFLKVITGKFSEDDVKRCISEINAVLAERNKGNHRYPVIVSMGMSVKKASDISLIHDLVVPADKEMLNNKAVVKKATGFNYSRDYIEKVNSEWQ